MVQISNAEYAALVVERDMLRTLVCELADYVERYADLNDEPEGGDCRTLLQRVGNRDATPDKP